MRRAQGRDGWKSPTTPESTPIRTPPPDSAETPADRSVSRCLEGSPPGEEASRDVLDPVTICGDLWRMGLVGQDAAPADPNTANFPVPELVGCTLANGIGAAFPRGDSTATSEEFCRDLGLTSWAG